MPIWTLALYAQRVGKIVAHPATWSKLIRDRGWRRPRLRVYPLKPKVGVGASAPNETWHIDVTILKLLDETKAYLHTGSTTTPGRSSPGSSPAIWTR